MFDPAIPKSTIASFFVAIFAIALPAVFASSSEFTKPAHHSVEELVLTNEVASAIGDEEEESLPTCPRGAACAHVQANSRGINVVEYCQCKKGKLAKFLGLTTFHDCPLTWDPEDGKSITQGSNQYKFCEQVPAPKKRVCEDTDIAYVVETTYPHIETMRIGQNFRHFCTCPLNTKFELKEYYTKNGPLADIDISEYTCAPLTTCKPEDSCKTVTETPESFIVENNCACPSPSKCPTSGKPSQEMPVGKGVVKFIPCQ